MVALGGVGIGLVVWSHHLLDAGVIVEDRGTIASTAEDRAALSEAFAEESGFSRRRLLIRLLLAAAGTLAAAAVVPVLSLGPAPARALFETSWRKGLRLVDIDGKPITLDRLPTGTVQTVFPEGAGQPSDSATVIVRVDPAQLQLAPDRAAWAPQGAIAFSKLCTHAGCPVGLYVEERHTLLCPCHQSEFDVLRAAEPVAGPAGRPLPQLPIQLQPDGTFIALGDYTGPVGPSFWDMNR
jgi:ubiquinol-cytochrome c reductase iron-sulfur subunit